MRTPMGFELRVGECGAWGGCVAGVLVTSSFLLARRFSQPPPQIFCTRIDHTSETGRETGKEERDARKDDGMA